MKKIGILVGIGVLTGLFAFCGVATATGRVGHRQFRQQKRIGQGIRSGELTRGEVRGLERQQVRIQRTKRRAWSDGKLQPWERARLEFMQDRASHRIYRYKHNDVTR
ncbi:MAG: hypothetical protein DRN37_06940 [Thermoplasmata archaeon]|nr:MAG: hypothetical protein B1H13_12590 [Desulfobacteraceae bacterium 4484_190.3]RLB18847.1 MAG: hypothetical protein DRG82_02965 [Deltaproteobacteria bacterium]RLF57173.1 MAG: hypothetical protein DRN37_06940 [Thermoplasmata archaeon]